MPIFVKTSFQANCNSSKPLNWNHSHINYTFIVLAGAMNFMGLAANVSLASSELKKYSLSMYLQ